MSTGLPTIVVTFDDQSTQEIALNESSIRALALMGSKDLPEEESNKKALDIIATAGLCQEKKIVSGDKKIGAEKLGSNVVIVWIDTSSTSSFALSSWDIDEQPANLFFYYVDGDYTRLLTFPDGYGVWELMVSPALPHFFVGKIDDPNIRIGFDQRMMKNPGELDEAVLALAFAPTQFEAIVKAELLEKRIDAADRLLNDILNEEEGNIIKGLRADGGLRRTASEQLNLRLSQVRKALKE